MLFSDIIGACASFSLLIPAAKDQFYRFSEARQQRKAAHSPWPGLRNAIGAAWKVRRDSYDAWDSTFLFFGALGLLISFFLKTLGS